MLKFTCYRLERQTSKSILFQKYWLQIGVVSANCFLPPSASELNKRDPTLLAKNWREALNGLPPFKSSLELFVALLVKCSVVLENHGA